MKYLSKPEALRAIADELDANGIRREMWGIGKAKETLAIAAAGEIVTVSLPGKFTGGGLERVLASIRSVAARRRLKLDRQTDIEDFTETR